MLSLLTVPLRKKRDVLLARQWARQVAVLLHYEMHDQSCIAAGTFAIAFQALHQGRPAELFIQIEGHNLHVFTKAASAGNKATAGSADKLLQLIKPLPARAAELSPEDLQWVLMQLNRQTHFHLFDEIHHQNQEMLSLLHTLHVAKTQLQQMKGSPSAA